MQTQKKIVSHHTQTVHIDPDDEKYYASECPCFPINPITKVDYTIAELNALRKAIREGATVLSPDLIPF